VTIAIAVTVGGLVLGHYLSIRESTDDAFVDGPIVAVAPRVGGTISAVHVVENQAVSAGDVLVELDPRDYKLALAKAEADLAAAAAAARAAAAQVPVATAASSSGLTAARARVAQAKAGLAAAEQGVAAAQARLEQARAAAEKAAQDVERYRRLVDKDELPRQTYEHAVAADRTARAGVAEAEQGVAAAGSRRLEAASGLEQARAALAEAETSPHQVESSKAQSSLAEARVEQARAALDLAQSHLGDTVVKAPADGVVGKKNAEVGETVQAGQPLVALVPLARIWITANFKETQIARMRPGQRASIYVDAFGESFAGHVESIGAATGSKFSLLPPENATGNFVKVVQRVPVRIALDEGQDPEHRLRPGLSVVPTVVTR